MRNFGKIPLLIVVSFAWLVIISSCANQGMPAGGPLDSIPPVLVESNPPNRSLNFNGDEIRLTFNEYIIPDAVSDVLVVSPPLEERPTVRMRSKTLMVKFNESLKENTTYSLDFKNSVVDNNERNPIGDLRLSFSTGNVLDSLRVAGRVVNAFSLEPAQNTLVMMHKNLRDSAVYTLRPDYIAKTDETGLFVVDNIAPGEYHILSLNDANADLLYNEGAEEIAFWDSIVVPSAEFIEEPDTMVRGTDSLLVSGHTHFTPDPIYLRLFTEDIFDQYLVSFSRNSRYQCNFIFNEPVTDSFDIKLIDPEVEDWYLLETNKTMDSVVVWLADTLIANYDTLQVELSYLQIDTTAQFFIQKDTVEMTYVDTEVENDSRRRRRDAEEEGEEKTIEQFNWQTNIGALPFDLNNSIYIISPEPLQSFDTSGIHLYYQEDATETPLEFSLIKDTTANRRYILTHPWQQETNYRLKIDSATAVNIYGISSRGLTNDFKTRPADYYGRITWNITDVTSPLIVQLLRNNDEVVLKEVHVTEDRNVIFDYLPPGRKYKIKVIFDENNNGIWDNGSFQDKIQPEKVVYYGNVEKTRSNWDNRIVWNVQPDLTYTKNVVDPEVIQQQREQEEQENQQQENNNQQRQNIFNPGGGINPIQR